MPLWAWQLSHGATLSEILCRILLSRARVTLKWPLLLAPPHHWRVSPSLFCSFKTIFYHYKASLIILFYFSDLLLGQGISNLLLALKRGGVILLVNTAGEKVLTNNMFLAFLFLMITLLLNITLIPLFKFQFKKQFGVLLVVNYVAFTILSFLTEFGYLFDREIWFEH